MNQKLHHWQQELDQEAVEEYNALRRSLQRNRGFGLFFVQCNPAVGNHIIEDLQEDIQGKKIEQLDLTKPIDSLYGEVEKIPHIQEIDILFISGLEYSLLAYEEYTFGNGQSDTYTNSKERFSQSWRGVPRFLGYLNLQRDRFREDFAISFIFFVPIFGINYFIKRAPDFFDWRSGFFRFIPQKESVTAVDIERIFQDKVEQAHHDLLTLQTLTKELPLSQDEQAQAVYKQFLLEMRCERYETAIVSVERWLVDNPDDSFAWYNRGIALGELGRLEEAIASYDRAIEIKPDYHEAWYNRGYALDELGRLEEARASYDKAIEIKPDEYEPWNGDVNFVSKIWTKLLGVSRKLLGISRK